MYQEGTEDPAPAENGTWMWKVKLNKRFVSTSGILLTASRNLSNGCQPRDSYGMDSQFSVMMTCVTVIMCIGILALATVAVSYLRMRKLVEDPEMDENEYYGKEEDYYDEHDNRVEDKNDYYL